MYKLYRAWNNIKELPCTIKCCIENLVYWLPVIWSDRDWDHTFFFVILAHKLASIERRLGREESMIVNVRMARIAIERLRDDKYDTDALALHEKKWGELTMIRTGKSYVFSMPKAITDKEKEQERKEWRIAFAHAQYLRQQDLDCFADIFRKHVLGWWD